MDDVLLVASYCLGCLVVCLLRALAMGTVDTSQVIDG